MRVPDPHPEEKALTGWKEIASYLGVGLRTAMRWADRQKYPLPYHETLGHPWALPSELQVWLRQNTISGQVSASQRDSE